jgi:Na+-transporting NADH:ubiquinone oxidoreductase subunit NqrF
VTYADDLVILCKKGNADQALQQLRKIMGKLKLTVNEEKTRICPYRAKQNLCRKLARRDNDIEATCANRGFSRTCQQCRASRKLRQEPRVLARQSQWRSGAAAESL